MPSCAEVYKFTSSIDYSLQINSMVLFLVEIVFSVNLRCFYGDVGSIYCSNNIWKSSYTFHPTHCLCSVKGIIWEPNKIILVVYYDAPMKFSHFFITVDFPCLKVVPVVIWELLVPGLHNAITSRLFKVTAFRKRVYCFERSGPSSWQM